MTSTTTAMTATTTKLTAITSKTATTMFKNTSKNSGKSKDF